MYYKYKKITEHKTSQIKEEKHKHKVGIHHNNITFENMQLIQCAVCFEDKPEILFPSLPCCGSGGREETSSVRFCGPCLVSISNTKSNSLCRCPRCRSWLLIDVETTNENKEKVTCREASTGDGKCNLPSFIE